MNIALIVSGGIGKRLNNPIPKQYLSINNKKIISYVIDAANGAKNIDKVIVSARKDFENIIRLELSAEFTEAGETRNYTIKNSLEYINKNYLCDRLIILDAVRPFIDSGIIEKYIILLDHYQAVTTARKITDSLGSYDIFKVNRDRYYLLSSPEAFDFGLLYKYFDAESNLTEIIHQFPEDINYFLNFDYFNNLKITDENDLQIARLLIKEIQNQI